MPLSESRRKVPFFSISHKIGPRDPALAARSALGELDLVVSSPPRARTQGEPGIIEIAENAAARVRTDCPLEAEAGGV